MATLAGTVPGIIDTHIHQWDPFTPPGGLQAGSPLPACSWSADPAAAAAREPGQA